MRVGLVVAACAFLAGCQPKQMYADETYKLFVHGLFKHGGEPVSLHPAVLEYVFATPDGPWGRYYVAAVEHDPPPPELALLEPEARAIAGSERPSAADYARARARRLSMAFNAGFVAGKGEAWAGTVQVQSDTQVWRSGRIGAKDGWFFTVNRSAQVVRLVGFRKPRTVNLAWDLQYVPGAFDPGAQLDYATVAKSIAPLHAPGVF